MGSNCKKNFSLHCPCHGQPWQLAALRRIAEDQQALKDMLAPISVTKNHGEVSIQGINRRTNPISHWGWAGISMTRKPLESVTENDSHRNTCADPCLPKYPSSIHYHCEIKSRENWLKKKNSASCGLEKP